MFKVSSIGEVEQIVKVEEELILTDYIEEVISLPLSKEEVIVEDVQTEEILLEKLEKKTKPKKKSKKRRKRKTKKINKTKKPQICSVDEFYMKCLIEIFGDHHREVEYVSTSYDNK